MISSQRLGQRLEAARKAKDLTQAETARHLNVPRQAVVAFEKGERRPSASQIVLLAEIYGVSVHELVREAHASRASVPRQQIQLQTYPGEVQRAFGALLSRAQRFATLEQRLGRTVSPTLLSNADRWQLDAGSHPLAPERDAEDAARSVRRVLGLGDAPAKGLTAMMERALGLRVFRLRLPDDVAALLAWNDDLGGGVALNSRLPTEQRRWALAHEVGVLLRNRELGDVLPVEDPSPRDAQWVFAETFAAALLLPEEAVHQYFCEAVRAGGGAFSMTALVGMARHFGVHLKTLALRLETLKLLPRGTWGRAVGDNVRPATSASAVGVFTEHQLDLVFEAFAREFVTETELAELLGTDIAEARLLFATRRSHRLDAAQEADLDLGHDLLRVE